MENVLNGRDICMRKRLCVFTDVLTVLPVCVFLSDGRSGQSV